MEHLASAEKEDAVVNKTVSCVVMPQNELASGITVFWGSENGVKPLLHWLSTFSTILASLLISLILTCHRKTPSKLCKRNPAPGSLPSFSDLKEGFWLTLSWHRPSCASPLNSGEGAKPRLARPGPKAHCCDPGMGSHQTMLGWWAVIPQYEEEF